ncbi:MAG TPA: ABC transporter permease [Thermomicrobiales bacterium]|nr:ABC transporter permease [Thermomicrobiales bacterium]
MATFIAEPPVARSTRAVDPATNVNNRMETRNLAVTFSRVIRSEWVKFRSLQSNWITMLSAVVTMIGIGALSTAFLSGTIGSGGDGFGDTTDPTTTSLGGMMLAQIIVGIVGVLAITSEFANGMIRSTFAAVPKRLPVLWAKVVVVAGVTFAIMLPATFASFFIGQAFMGSDGASLSDTGVLRAVIESAGYLTAIALLGLGLGSILRRAAGAIGTVFALLLIAPGLLELVLPASFDNVLRYLPSNASLSFTSVGSTEALLSPAVGALVVLGWVAGLVGVAAVLLKRRDA